MLKMTVNVFELKFRIRPKGPLLIKSGVEAGANPLLPHMNFVRSSNPTGETTIYLPGSSLKGVFRSHAERIARTVNVDCCDPLSTENACDCRAVFKNKNKSSLSGWETYKNVCTVCRLFGHNVIASRLTLPDAYPTTPIDTLPVRQMVAIDRRSGGSTNTFTMEVATPDLFDGNDGGFEARVLVQNFERWQIGLLALVLRDLNEGMLPIGFGKSRGLGQVELLFDELTLTYPGLLPGDTRLVHVLGMGELHSQEARQYNFHVGTLPEATDLPQNAVQEDGWGRARIMLNDTKSITAILQSQAQAWRDYVEVSQI